MWNGPTNIIPDGWALCNGLNGTPDLRDRFIVGAGSNYSPGNTGGSNSVTLSTSQIPSHTHTGPSHSHSVSVSSGTSATLHYDYSVGGNSTSTSIMKTASTSRKTTSTVSGTTGSTGGGSSHENRPPYYALCFIMKL